MNVLRNASEGKLFSAGNNLKELTKDSGMDFHKAVVAKASELKSEILKCPVPVIATVDGPAAAAGCQLIAACDLVMCSDRSSFSTPGGEGQRNWIKVLCNAGFAAQLALFYMLDCGSGERAIDFVKQYRSSWLGIGIMSSFACSNSDTWASELGTILGSSDPFLITTRQGVPRGMNGGVSYPGLFFSFLGGLAIGATYYLTVIYTVEYHSLKVSARQWPIILFGGIAGIVGLNKTL